MVKLHERAISNNASQQEASQLKNQLISMENFPVGTQSHVAIVGIGMNMPGDVHNLDAYWEFLCAERNAVSQQSMQGGVQRYCAAIELNGFDANFFNISDREAETLDPQQMLLLESSWNALEDANIAPSSLKGAKVGVFFGMSGIDNMIDLAKSGVADAYLATGNSHAAAAGRVAYHFGFHGPALALDTACSSSLTALHYAIRSLRCGESDAALVGAVNLARAGEFNSAFSLAKMLSPEGKCKALSQQADGYVRGEGCVVFLVKRYQDAIQDRDRIYGVVLGSALNQDGASAGLTVPNGIAQEEVIHDALRDASLKPQEIQYVEAHGTGTVLGDPIELRALSRAYGMASDRKEALLVGSVKNNVGHLEAAAGFASLLKVLLILLKKEIPATIHCSQPTNKIDWAKSNLAVVNRKRPYPAGINRRICAVSAFSFAGTNAHILVEASQDAAPCSSVPQTAFTDKILPLSAKTGKSLARMAASYASYLASQGDEGIATAVALASRCRDHHAYRAAFPYSSKNELLSALSRYATEERPNLQYRDEIRAAFVFTGQGSQYLNMAEGLYERYPVFAASIDASDRILREVHAGDLKEMLWGTKQHLLDRTRYCQPALVALELAIAELLFVGGISPVAVIGHSLGEITAAIFAQVLSPEDGLEFAAYRGMLMEDAPPGAMLAVVASNEDISKALARLPTESEVSAAAFNATSITVYSGSPDAIDLLAATLKSLSIETHRLKSAKPFHSPLMAPVADELTTFASRLRHLKARIPIATNVFGQWANEKTFDATYWQRHALEPVRFNESVGCCVDAGCNIFVEIGPGNALAAMIKSDYGDRVDVTAALVKNTPAPRSVLDVAASLYEKGCPIDWEIFDPTPLRRVAILPSYPYDRLPSARKTSRWPAFPDKYEATYRKIALANRDYVFEHALSLDCHPYLADHRIGTTIVVPAAFYLGAYFDTARQVAGNDISIGDIQFLRPLTLEPGQTWLVQLHYVLLAAGEWQANFYAALPDDHPAPDWSLYAQAKIGKPRGSANTLRPSSDATEIDAGTFYEKLKAAGLNYGKQFRTLRTISSSDDGAATAELTAPLHDDSDLVCRLDGAFQLIAAAIGEQAWHKLLVPSRIDAMEINAAAGSWKFAEVGIVDGPAKADSHEVKADILLKDADGAIVAAVRGMLAREGILRQAEDRDTDAPMQFVATWGECASELMQDARTDGAGSLRRKYLFSGNARECAALSYALASHLQDQGEHNIRVVPSLQACLLEHEASEGGTNWADTLQLVLVCDADDTSGSVMASGPGAAFGSSLLDLLKLIQASNRDVRLTVIGTGATGGSAGYRQAVYSGMLLGAATECARLSTRWIDVEPERTHLPTIAALLGNRVAPGFTELRCINDKVYKKIWAPEATTPDARPLRLASGQIGTLDRLSLSAYENAPLPPDHVRIRIHASALNYRDVLHALGALEENQTEIGATNSDTLLFGAECAGIVDAVGSMVDRFKIGDRVYAGPAIGSIATMVDVDQAFVDAMPDRLSFAEAATLPIAFLTAHIALVEKARLQRGETVLIHGGAGGVGLAAIQIARQIGARIVVTASQGKWGYLRSIGLTHIHDSRTLHFADAIRKEMDGVDVVLNSLNGDFIGKSMALLVEGGRFVDIGKLGQWSPEQAREAFPRINYHQFDLLEIARCEPGMITRALHRISDMIERKVLQPLPVNVQPIANAAAAFSLMRSSMHIGKIALDIESRGGAAPMPACTGPGTYVVTGGTGGIGAEVLGYLRHCRASHVLVLGRRDNASLTDGGHEGMVVRYLQCDVADEAQVSQAIEKSMLDMPRCVCVVHAAGLLLDKPLDSTDWADVTAVCRPKVDGLDNLFGFFGTKVRYVLFSSIASAAGSVGQIGYVAANSYLDSFANYWRGKGVAVTSVNWGPWAGAGMAADAQRRGGASLQRLGLGQIDSNDAGTFLQKAFSAAHAQILLARIHWQRLCESGLAKKRPLLDLAGDSAGMEKAGASLDDHVGPKMESVTQVQQEVLSAVRHVLRQRGQVTIPLHTKLRQLGMDSLMLVELLAKLGGRLGVKLPVAAISAHTSINDIADAIFLQLRGEDFQEQANIYGITSSWIISPPKPGAARALICFHHMGGQASVYADWQENLGAGADVYTVQFPGREMRIDEAYANDLLLAAQNIASDIAKLGLPEINLYGHSMGALVAFEVAHALREHHGIGTAALFVGGLWAPDRHQAELRRRDFTVEAAVRDMQIPEALLGEKKFLQGFLPMFEADARLFQSYIYRERAALGCPINVFLGNNDPVASWEEGEGWRVHSSEHFAIRTVPGSHMFHRESATELSAHIGELMETSCR